MISESCALLIAPVPESVSRSIVTRREETLKRLNPSSCNAFCRSSGVVRWSGRITELTYDSKFCSIELNAAGYFHTSQPSNQPHINFRRHPPLPLHRILKKPPNLLLGDFLAEQGVVKPVSQDISQPMRHPKEEVRMCPEKSPRANRYPLLLQPLVVQDQHRHLQFLLPASAPLGGTEKGDQALIFLFVKALPLVVDDLRAEKPERLVKRIRVKGILQ